MHSNKWTCRYLFIQNCDGIYICRCLSSVTSMTKKSFIIVVTRLTFTFLEFKVYFIKKKKCNFILIEHSKLVLKKQILYIHFSADEKKEEEMTCLCLV